LDSAFFVIETPPLLKGVNNSTANMALPKSFMMTLPTLFEHYSHPERERRISRPAQGKLREESQGKLREGSQGKMSHYRYDMAMVIY
jgi:hypothetical protein